MNDIDPSAVMSEHDGHGADHLGLCSYQASHRRGRCTTYRLAEALAASEAKVARVEVLADTWHHGFVGAAEKVRAALADQPERAS